MEEPPANAEDAVGAPVGPDRAAEGKLLLHGMRGVHEAARGIPQDVEVVAQAKRLEGVAGRVDVVQIGLASSDELLPFGNVREEPEVDGPRPHRGTPRPTERRGELIPSGRGRPVGAPGTDGRADVHGMPTIVGR
jgi:hypothetical protein